MIEGVREKLRDREVLHALICAFGEFKKSISTSKAFTYFGLFCILRIVFYDPRQNFRTD